MFLPLIRWTRFNLGCTFLPVTMTLPPALVPGRVYRTRELRAFSANSSRWAKRLVEQGVLRQPHHGLFYAPVQSRFGLVGVTDEELLRAFLGTDDFLITGPDVWNALGLGTTQLFAVTLVYNGGRTGEVELGGRRFWFRRVRFPKDPPPEWYVVDLYQNERWMAEDTTRLDEHLARALRVGRLDRARLEEMVSEYARPALRGRLMRVLASSASAA
jgi:hypothetical protein